jgi:hypothetical protein
MSLLGGFSSCPRADSAPTDATALTGIIPKQIVELLVEAWNEAGTCRHDPYYLLPYHFGGLTSG